MGANRIWGQVFYFIETENNTATMLLYLIELQLAQRPDSQVRDKLLDLDWTSDNAFFRALVRLLEGDFDRQTSLTRAATRDEQAWFNFALALLKQNQGAVSAAEELLAKAVSAAYTDNRVYFLARSQLDRLQQKKLLSCAKQTEQTQCRSQIQKTNLELNRKRDREEEQRQQLTALLADDKQGTGSLQEKQSILEEMLVLDPGNRTFLYWLTYVAAMRQDWELAVQPGRSLPDSGSFESREHLSLGLLLPIIFQTTDQADLAEQGLKAFIHKTGSVWFKAIARTLQFDQDRPSLFERAATSPERILTASTFLGFWMEATGRSKEAAPSYREALGTYLDTWIEYEFARERLKRLRKES